MADNKKAPGKGSKKKTFIVFGLCSFIALVICMLTLIIVVKNVEKNDNSQTQNNKTEQILENEKSELSEYIAAATQKTVNNKFVKVNVSTDVSIDDGTIVVDGKTEGRDVQLFTYFKNQAIGQIDALYGEDYTGEFGIVYPRVPHVVLPTDTKIKCNMTKGLTDEDGNPVYDDEGVLVDKDFYFISFTAPGGVLTKEEKTAFGLEDTESVKDGVNEVLASVCSIKNLKITPQEFKINTKSDVYTDRLEYLEYKYVYKIDADIEFINDFKVFGEKNVSFEYVVTKKYDYSFVSVAFSQDALYLEKGREAQLSVNAVIEDDSEYEIKFISDKPDVVTIDEMGYVNILKESEKPVKVKVELQYLGEKFYDECYVYTTAQENS